MAEALLEETWQAIRTMSIRGATRISVAAADALAGHIQSQRASDWKAEIRRAASHLASARPSAVSLENGLSAVARPALASMDAPSAARAAMEAAASWARRLREGRAIIAQGAASLLPREARVLTHCHSATVVAVLKHAYKTGRIRNVLATETRPWRQGLTTVRELAAAGIPTKLIVDSAAGHFLRESRIDAVVVGADTVCRDGTVINKIGTGTVALAARDAGVPVFCATSFCKFTHRDAHEVAIEEREAAEVARAEELPAGVGVLNPVFDRTRPDLVSQYITEDGVHGAVNSTALALRAIPAKVPW